MSELFVAPCSHFMAKQAVGRWHYSRRLPSGEVHRFGVWESGVFIGVVLFGNGAAPRIADPFGLKQSEVMEMVRVALTSHQNPVTRIVAVAIRQLRHAFPSLRVLVSFADPKEGHHGGIYQAGNWIYLGEANAMSGRWLVVDGRLRHPMSVFKKYGTRSVGWLRQHIDPAARRFDLPAKHKYVLPLDAEMRAQLAPLAKPYPKRAGSIDSDVTANPAGEGGASPTSALDLFGEVA